MKRAKICLNDAEYEALRAAAFKQHTSISAILRKLVRVNIVGKLKPKKRYAAGLMELIGLVHETRPDVAERHDDYLWGEAD